MVYTGLLSLLLAEYAANQKCSGVLLCSADSIYPVNTHTGGGGGERRDGREKLSLARRTVCLSVVVATTSCDDDVDDDVT